MDEDGPSTVAVSIEASGWRDAIPDPEGLCQRAVRATLRRTAPEIWRLGAEVSVLLADDRTLRRLNATWRGIDRPTNVLSFPAPDLGPDASPGGVPGTSLFLGDLALAWETVRREAAAEGKPVAAHLFHLIVHGTLHLLGHDHQTDTEAHTMEQHEREILAGLGIADPYADDAGPGPNDEALEATS